MPSASAFASERRRRDVHAFAVFGDGAARDFVSLFVEQVGDFLVGERFFGFFAVDDFGNQRFDGDDGLVVAFAVFELCREEVAQLKNAAFADEVFAIDRAADGAFVDVQHFRDFLPGERPHRRFAFLEEVLLQGDDDVGDAADGVGAFVDGGQKPARFLQLGLQQGLVRAFGDFGDFGVVLVDGEFGADVFAGFDVADAVFFADDDFGFDVLRRLFGVALSGARIEAAQERNGVVVGGFIHAEALADHRRVFADEAEVTLHDFL